MSTAEDLFASESTELTPLAECAAFVSDGQTHDVIDAVTRQFYAETVIRDGGSKEAMQYLTEAPVPHVLIVDIGDSPSPLTAMLSLTAAFTEDTRLVGIGSMNDINLYREMFCSRSRSRTKKTLRRSPIPTPFKRLSSSGRVAAAAPRRSP